MPATARTSPKDGNVSSGTNSNNSMDAGTAGTHQEQIVTEGMPAIVGTPAEGMLATVGTPAAAMTPKTGGIPGTVMKPAISTPVTVETLTTKGTPSMAGRPIKKRQ
jgi:hypothetical protein